MIKRAGLVMVFGKKRKTSFFFFFLALFQSYLIDAIFDDDVLSLFSFLLSVGFYLLAKSILNELWFDEERERDKIIAYIIGTSEAAILHQNKTTDEREKKKKKEEGRVGKSFFTFTTTIIQKITLALNEWEVKTKRTREREMEKMKQDDENEEEATTVCQDFSDLFSLSLSLLSIGSRNHLLDEREERENELITEQVK